MCNERCKPHTSVETFSNLQAWKNSINDNKVVDNITVYNTQYWTLGIVYLDMVNVVY